MISEIHKEPVIGSPFLEELKTLHKDWVLCGEPRNALLSVSDTLLLYVLAVLRDEEPDRPDALSKVSMDEWEELLNVLRSHWIIPLLYYKTARLAPEFRPPGDITDRMRSAFLQSRVQCLKVENQLNEILNSFKRKGIDVIVLKGPALALSIYPDPAARPYCDLDLLVREEDFIKAGEALEDLGYTKDYVSKAS